MGPNPQETADLVPFTKEILNGNFIFVDNYPYHLWLRFSMILVRHQSADTIWKIIYDLSYTLLQGHSRILIFHTNQKNNLKDAVVGWEKYLIQHWIISL